MNSRYPLSPSEVGFLRRETLKALAQGSIPPAIAMYVLFSDSPLPLWGSDGLAAFQFKNSFGMAVVMTLLMSLGLRAGRAKGSVPALGWTRETQPLLRLIPRNLIARVVTFGVADMALIGSAFFAIVAAANLDGIGHLPLVLLMAGQCAVNALFLAPLILIGAMTDAVALKSKAAA